MGKWCSVPEPGRVPSLLWGAAARGGRWINTKVALEPENEQVSYFYHTGTKPTKLFRSAFSQKLPVLKFTRFSNSLQVYLWPNMVFASATYILWLNTISNFILFEQQTRYVTKLCRVTILLWDTLISKLKLRDRPDHLLFSLTKPIRVTTCEHKFLKWWFLREYLFIALLFRNISFSCNDVPFKLSGGNSFSEIYYTPQNIPPHPIIIIYKFVFIYTSLSKIFQNMHFRCCFWTNFNISWSWGHCF